MSHRLMNFNTIVAKHNDTQLHDNQHNDPQLDVTELTNNLQGSAQHNNNQYNEPK
jgi:hypothetical protein